jgi:hypothetical protein
VIPHLEKKRGKWQAHRVCQTEMSEAAQCLLAMSLAYPYFYPGKLQAPP